MCEIDRIIDRYFEDDDTRKKTVCAKMGMPYGTFCRKTNPNDDLTFNIREMIPLTLHTNFNLLDHIESVVGRVAFTTPKEGEELEVEHVVKMIRQCTKTINKLTKIIADGVIDEDEQKELDACMIEHNQVGSGFHAVVHNKRNG